MRNNKKNDLKILEEKKIRAVCYIRVSTADQEERYGPASQLSKIRSYLDVRSQNVEFIGKELDLNDDFVFFDGDVSGASKIDDRGELSRLFNILEHTGKENKPFDVVIVYKIDRFARDLRVLLDISDRFKNYGVGFISTQESIDTSNPFGNAMLGILGVFAELEREMIKERTMLGTEESFKLGIAKKVPYGYRKDADTKKTCIYERDAKIVKEIFEMVELGETIPDICRILKRRQVLIPTSSGSDKSHLSRIKDAFKWEDTTIRKMLKNKFYLGLLYYYKSKKIKLENGKEKTIHLPEDKWSLSTFKHPRLISDNTFNNVQIIIGKKKGNFHKSTHNYLLSGLLKCGYCEEHRPSGVINWGGTGGGGKQSYHCNGKKVRNKINGYLCPVVQLGKKELEELVINEIKGIFSNVEILEEYINSKKNIPNIINKKENDLDKANDKVRKAMNAIKILKVLGDKGEISPNEFSLQLEKKRELLKKSEKKLRDTENSYDKLFNEDKYKKGINIIKKIVKKDIVDLFNNEKDTKIFINFIIKDIYLYSRDKLKTDVVRGPSNSRQKIPYKLKIKFKLPQEFLKEYIKFSTR